MDASHTTTVLPRFRRAPTIPRRKPLPTVPRLSVVIVNFRQWQNTARLTRRLLDSEMIRNGDAEVVIVDNNSPDHGLRRELGNAPDVCIRRFSRNTGFSFAVNEGCRISSGEWVLLLNPDTSVPHGFLDHVDRLARDLAGKDDRAGIVGFRLRHRDGSLQASCGDFPTLGSTLAGLCLPRAVRKCRIPSATQPIPVGWVTGCCLLIHRDCLRELGGFDEQFFLYYEDVDLCRRAAELGYRTYFDPRLEVIHHSPLHTRTVSPALRMMTRHALLTYAGKHWSRFQQWLLGGVVWAESLVRQLRGMLRGDREAVEMSSQLRRMVGDMLHGRSNDVRDRLRSTALRIEENACVVEEHGE